MNFTTFLSEEKITAADFENFITVAFNGGPKKDKDTPIKSMAAYEANLPALKNIVKALKGSGFKGRMIQTGKAQGKLSPAWTGTDKTPKADMVVGKRGISLKKRGGSQLTSAKQAETMSTFNAAVGFMDSEVPGEATKLANDLSALMLEYAVPKKLGNIGEFLKKIKNPTEYRKTRGNERKLANEYLSKTDMMKVMTERVRTFFDGNDTFRNFFVYEAATGAEKFKPDPSASANYIVAFDEAGSTSIHQISKGYGKIGPYIPKLASTVKLRISWKTHSSKSQKTFPSFRADVRDDVNDEVTFQSLFDEHFSELNENIFTDAKNFLSNIKDSIQDFIKKAAALIYKLAKKGIMAVLKFLGILPEKIAVSQALIEETLNEAEYQGKEVKLNDPFRLPQGSKKKFGVYVKKPSSGNVVMVKFGDPNLSIKRDDPERLKNFRARHNCSSKTDKTTPGYWSCKFWEKDKPVSKLLSKGSVSEKWSEKYKESIDCDNPKGFSQKAHCQGKNKNEEEQPCDCGCEQQVNEVNIPDFKGWVNPKTGKTRIIQGHTPYHVQMIVKDPKFYGIKETDIHDVLTKEALANNAPDEFRAETAATRELDDLKSGRQDVSVMVDSLIIEKGWVRVVSGKFGEITSTKKYSASSKELRKILQMLDKETDITNMSDVDVGLQTHKKKSDKRVQVTPYDNLKIQDIRNIVKGRKRGDKQTEIGRTMAMFREEKRVAKTRKNQDPDTHSDLYTDEDPRGTIHGLGFKDVETAEASVRKIKASDRTHAHKTQAAIAMEQRAKVMKKTAEAAVYRKFIEEMKKKTKEMNEVYKDSGLGDWFGKGGGGGKEKGGWDRYNASGERIGKCGDAPEGAAYSACLSAEKADQLGKEGRAKFVQRKRDAQKKSGDKAKGGESKKGQKPVMVSTGAKGLDKKNESFMSFRDFISEGENKPNNPALWKKAISKAKAKFDVYPSAYANAWASKWYKGEGGTWSKK